MKNNLENKLKNSLHKNLQLPLFEFKDKNIKIENTIFSPEIILITIFYFIKNDIKVKNINEK